MEAALRIATANPVDDLGFLALSFAFYELRSMDGPERQESQESVFGLLEAHYVNDLRLNRLLLSLVRFGGEPGVDLVDKVVAGSDQRLRAYLDAHPAFYGSAAALVDEAGTVTASPYVYRTADGYQTLDLAQPEYEFEAQGWITMPLAADTSIWTPPYFDEGGGEIWMTTRSVPARDAGGIFAIVTTDLPVDAPGR